MKFQVPAVILYNEDRKKGGGKGHGKEVQEGEVHAVEVREAKGYGRDVR